MLYLCYTYAIRMLYVCYTYAIRMLIRLYWNPKRSAVVATMYLTHYTHKISGYLRQVSSGTLASNALLGLGACSASPFGDMFYLVLLHQTKRSTH